MSRIARSCLCIVLRVSPAEISILIRLSVNLLKSCSSIAVAILFRLNAAIDLFCELRWNFRVQHTYKYVGEIEGLHLDENV